MPDLSHLARNQIIKKFALYGLAGGGSGFSEQLQSYRSLFARLVDKAVKEYLLARKYAVLTVDNSLEGEEGVFFGDFPVYYHIIANYLEDCIATTRRLFRYFDRIKTELPVDKTTRRYIESLESEIKDIRDVVEHLDKDIHAGKKEKSQVAVPTLSVDATNIVLLDQSLSTQRLASAIEKLHAFGIEFMAYKYVNGSFIKI